MKRILPILGAVALVAAFVSPVLAQPAGYALITDPDDSNLVMPAANGTYVISEYYCGNYGASSYLINGLLFTNDFIRVGGNQYVNPTPENLNFAATQDGTNLDIISEGSQYKSSFDFTVPTVAGHNYVLELLFHDDAWKSIGQRVFSVYAGPQGNATGVLYANMDLVQLGAGDGVSGDVVLRYVLNNSSGSPLEIKMSASVNNALISGLALLDVSASTALPQLFIGPANQTGYVGSYATFSCAVAGPIGTTYQWQTDAGQPGTFTNLVEGVGGASGSTTATLTLTNLTLAGQANYQVVVTDGAGPVTSTPAALTVTYVPGLSVIAGPTDPRLLLAGATNFYFAEYYGAINGPLTIGGLTFQNNNARMTPYNIATENAPYFGPTSDDVNLALISESDVYDSAGFNFTLPTVAGRNYVLQLLFHDNAYSTVGERLFNVNAGLTSQGQQTLVQNLDLVDAGAFQTNPLDVLVTYGVTNTDASGLVVQLQQVTDNPMLSAMTFQDVTGGPVPPLIVTEPAASANVFAGRTVTMSAGAVGTPLYYNWQSGPPYTNLIDGGNLWGSATATLTITNIALAEAGTYQLLVTNLAGIATSSAETVTVTPVTTVISPAANYYPWAIISSNAVDYWRLNEPNGAALVYDSGPGGKDGVTGSSLNLGQPGPEPPDFPGFEDNNACMATAASNANEFVTAPALGLNTNTITMLVWLYPTNNQSPGAGIMLDRAGSSGPATGLAYGITPQPFGDYSLRYFWNGASADSGIQVPQNMWSMLALVVTPTNVTLYILNANGMNAWSTAAANAVCAFADTFLIGNDPADGGNGNRTFTGSLDEPAVFTKALTQSQIAGLFGIASGISVLPPSVAAPTPTLTITNAGATVVLTGSAGGIPAPTLQWMKRPLGLTGPYANVPNGSGISGATTASLTISGVSAYNIGDYILVASNIVGTASSTAARVLVIQSNAPALIGQWLAGSQSLAELSLYDGANVHNGVLSIGSPIWSNSVPNGFSGSSLALYGTNAVIITNAMSSDSDYRLTYDNNMTNSFSVACWAKGFPSGAWTPFIGKNCESTHGWAMRHNNTAHVPTFSLQGTVSGFTDAGSGASVDITDGNWHHYCGTYDSIAGVRHLYVDGVDVLNVTRDFGGVVPANGFRMCLGAEDNPAGTLERFYTGALFDARVYNYALAPAEVQAIMNPGSVGTVGVYFNTTASVTLGQTVGFSVVIPIGADASGPVTVWVTNNAPSVATINGATGNVFVVTFARGAPTTQSFTLDTIGSGQISLSAGATGYSATIGTAPPVVQPQLIGHWLSGAQSLADTANYVGPGVHDGSASAGSTIGGASGSVTWSSDVPAAFSGNGLSSLVLNGSYAVTVGNSSTLALNYQPTFDENLAEGFSVSFWAKGLPAAGSPWVSKSGNTGNEPGWEIIQLVSGTALDVPSFTLRETDTSANNSDVAIPYNSPTLIDANWHLYTATWDGIAGERKLYVDGQLSLTEPNDQGPAPSAMYSYLTLGGYDSANASQSTIATSIGSYFTGEMFDVRMYNYALSASEVSALAAPSAAALTAAADTAVIDQGYTGTVSLSLPPGANASVPVTVWVTNVNPSIVSIEGVAGNVFSLTFAAGAYPTERLTLTGLSQGQATIAVGASGFTSASATVQVYAPQLVGHWLYGDQNLNEVSGFTPAHTHDGVAVTLSSAATAAWIANVPPGFLGSSLNLGGTYGVWVTNSDARYSGYHSTFDDVIANHFTVAFWANCQLASSQSSWVGLVGKAGDDGMGFQFHRYSGNNQDDFVLRDSGSHVSDLQSPNYGSGVAAGPFANTWVHIAIVFDGYNGYRAVYTNGVIQAYQPDDYGSYTLAKNHHLVFGTEEQPASANAILTPQLGDNGYLKGYEYDMRIYNYALSQAQVQALMVPSRPTLSVQPLPGGVIQLSWSVAYPGYVLESESAFSDSWTSGPTATLQNGQYTATDTIGAGPKFYRLVFQ